jgi:cullin-associated NEDD8-dissociated protein 1
LIGTVGTISRTVGYRLGRYLDKIVPLFLRFCGSAEEEGEEESSNSEAANELREQCFSGIESVLTRCPGEVAPFIPDILRVALSFVKYDPNYSYDEDNNEEEGEMEVVDAEGDDMEEEEEEGFGSDNDDDSSWKVRKAAVKVIGAILSSRPDQIALLYDSSYVDVIVSRFKEREENVRLDIINFITNLVNTTYLLSTSSAQRLSNSQSIGSAITGRQRSDLLNILITKVNLILKSSFVQLSGSSAKSKSAIFNLLRTVVVTLNVCIVIFSIFSFYCFFFVGRA